MTGKNRRPQAAVVTQATLERAARALLKSGTPFAGYRVWPDGRVDVLAGEPSIAPPTIAPDAVEQAIDKWDAQHGYGKAS